MRVPKSHNFKCWFGNCILLKNVFSNSNLSTLSIQSLQLTQLIRIGQHLFPPLLRPGVKHELMRGHRLIGQTDTEIRIRFPAVQRGHRHCQARHKTTEFAGQIRIAAGRHHFTVFALQFGVVALQLGVLLL